MNSHTAQSQRAPRRRRTRRTVARPGARARPGTPAAPHDTRGRPGRRPVRSRAGRLRHARARSRRCSKARHPRLLEQTTPIQSAVLPIALSGRRRHRLRRNRHRQDGRVRAADPRTGCCGSARAPRAERGTTRVLILAPTRELARRSKTTSRASRITPTSRASPSTAACRWSRRSARSRPASTSSSPRPAGCWITCAAARRLLDARNVRARRSRPHDGHGLLARRPPHRRRRCRDRHAPDAAVLGDDAGRSDEARGRDRARPAVRAGRIARRSGADDHARRSRTSRRREKTEWLAKFLRRTHGPMLVFVRTKIGRERLARKLQSIGLPRGGAARRPHAAAAHGGGRRLPRGPLSRARRDRRRRARPRHRRHHARRQLRSADAARPTCTASAAPAARTPPARR